MGIQRAVRKLSRESETDVLLRCARRCCLCFYLENDLSEKEGQIAHLDRNPANGVDDNLAFLCLRHHTLYDSRTSQHKNYTCEEIKVSRTRLYEVLKTRKSKEWVLVLNGTFSERNKTNVETIMEHLKNLLDDPHLTIRRITDGSIRVLVESSEMAMKTLIELAKSGAITEIGGYPIVDVLQASNEDTHAQSIKRPSEPAKSKHYGGSGLLDSLLDETIARRDGVGPVVTLEDTAIGRLYVVTLGITRIIEQESLEVSIWGSSDTIEWGTRPLAQFPLKSFCGMYSILLNLAAHSHIRHLRVQWKMDRWTKGNPTPLFGFYVDIELSGARVRKAADFLEPLTERLPFGKTVLT